MNAMESTLSNGIGKGTSTLQTYFSIKDGNDRFVVTGGESRKAAIRTLHNLFASVQNTVTPGRGTVFLTIYTTIFFILHI